MMGNPARIGSLAKSQMRILYALLDNTFTAFTRRIQVGRITQIVLPWCESKKIRRETEEKCVLQRHARAQTSRVIDMQTKHNLKKPLGAGTVAKDASSGTGLVCSAFGLWPVELQ